MATINTDIAQKIDIIARENNTATINLVIADSAGTAFSLADYNVTFTIYDSSSTYITKSNGNGGITATASGSSTLDSTGKITIKMSVSDLSILPGTYTHKLVLSSTDGNETKTWMYGKFKLNND
jgi:hypothetical protein